MLEIPVRLSKIRFRNDDNYYTVAECVSCETQTTITVVGYLVGTREGDSVIIRGRWEKHARFGQQFAVDSFEPLLPTTLDGIKGYIHALGVKGLSPKIIRALVREFGDQTLTVIDQNPKKLKKVKGIGNVLGDRLIDAWSRHDEVRKLSLFLQGNHIPASFCAGIYRAYGSDAIASISRSPYALTSDFPEMPFALIDSAARNMGIDRNDPQRISACILYNLDLFSAEGHVYIPKDTLTERCAIRYGIDAGLVDQGITDLLGENRIVIEQETDPSGVPVVFTKALHRAETGIASTLFALNTLPSTHRALDKNEIIETVLKKLAIALSDEQLTVLEDVLSHRVAIITGGPGTGKTTLIRSITAIFNILGNKTLLSAPTGRAARRLSEVTGEPAATIHKMLQYSLTSGQFEKNRDNPLDADVVIIDEASMVDTLLMYHLVNAIPFTASVIFVGDIFQLPSVGPGTVLSDLIQSHCFRTFELTKIFRQAQESQIILNSHRVRYGKMPKFQETGENGALSEFYFIETADPVKVSERVVELCRHRIPDKYCFDPMTDIQVLTPMHKGDVGTISLNAALQETLNPGGKHIERFGMKFKEGDKVMHLKNNYEKDVFNGDIGTIEDLDRENKVITVNYDGKSVEYEYDELNELTLAYAISVHKSQGSEYPAVVVPVTTQHYPLLQRNLLYTAMTRGKKLVVLIGTKRALSIALENDTPRKRMTGLEIRLKLLHGDDGTNHE